MAKGRLRAAQLVRGLWRTWGRSTSGIRAQGLRLHAGTSEPSHLHSLVSWREEKGWLAARNGLKGSLSRRLTKESEGGNHFRLSEGASRKHVKDRKHFDYLMGTYLPKHRGVAWYEDERKSVEQYS